MKKVQKILMVLMLFVGLSYGVKQIPIVIEADQLLFDNRKNIAVYSGNAKIKRGDLLIKADKIQVILSRNGDISKFIATGHVLFKAKSMWAKADAVQYSKDKNYIVLKGNAELHQQNTVVKGEEIRYYFDDKRFIVIGKGKKVKTIIIPESK